MQHGTTTRAISPYTACTGVLRAYPTRSATQNAWFESVAFAKWYSRRSHFAPHANAEMHAPMMSICRSNFREDVPAILAVWVPAQFVNFGFSPLWFRVPFVATVSAFWTGYVSLTRGAGGYTSEGDLDIVIQEEDTTMEAMCSGGGPAVPADSDDFESA